MARSPARKLFRVQLLILIDLAVFTVIFMLWEMVLFDYPSTLDYVIVASYHLMWRFLTMQIFFEMAILSVVFLIVPSPRMLTVVFCALLTYAFVFSFVFDKFEAVFWGSLPLTGKEFNEPFINYVSVGFAYLIIRKVGRSTRDPTTADSVA